MFQNRDTIAAQATAAGEGGVAIVRVSGADCQRIISRVFRAKNGKPLENRVLTYDQIYEKVWGDFSSGGERETIGFHIRNLRRKLFDTDQEPAYQIESIRDVGYRFQYN